MPPMRKPFVSSTASAMGDTGMPGMPMPPQAGITGPQPQMPMGGKPQGAPMGGSGDPMQDAMAGSAAAAAMPAVPGASSPGGPTSPMNISQMLQARMGDRSAAPQSAPGGAPQSPPFGDGLPAWGDQGTRAGEIPGMQGPKRVPLNADAMTPMPDATAGVGGVPGAEDLSGLMGNNNGSAVMMRLLRTLGKV